MYTTTTRRPRKGAHPFIPVMPERELAFVIGNLAPDER